MSRQASPAHPDKEPETRLLLDWYDRHARALPWRAASGVTPDPYGIWLSEIMLQQTTVATVRNRYQAFLHRWPTVTALAEASLDEVLHEWQGLGYYARARNLHRCAITVAERPDAAFPDTEEGLRDLPGIGDYTAAAIAAIAFERPSAPVDGNVIRVISRLRAIADEMPANKARIAEAVRPLVPGDRPGDFAQAMMDLGATVCTPRNPACGVCPWVDVCAAHRTGDPAGFPAKARKKARPTRFGTVFWVRDHAGRVAMRRRPEKGLLGGLSEFPSTPWRTDPWPVGDATNVAGIATDWTPLAGCVKHTFTHFHLILEVLVADRVPADTWPEEWRAVLPGDFTGEALPTVMKKVVRLVSEG